MAKAQAAAAAKPAAEAKPVAEKKERVIGGHKLSAVITLGTDKEGVKFGPKNNPKREGSASAGRFANYRDGMTIEKALAAGLTSGDIVFDSDPKRGFITLTD